MESRGLGQRRLAAQKIRAVDHQQGIVDLVGARGRTGACHGDSGGGAFIAAEDGTWRLFGVAQSLLVPTHLKLRSAHDLPSPRPPRRGDTVPVCGYGARYTLLTQQSAWLTDFLHTASPPS